MRFHTEHFYEIPQLFRYPFNCSNKINTPTFYCTTSLQKSSSTRQCLHTSMPPYYINAHKLNTPLDASPDMILKQNSKTKSNHILTYQQHLHISPACGSFFLPSTPCSPACSPSSPRNCAATTRPISEFSNEFSN